MKIKFLVLINSLSLLAVLLAAVPVFAADEPKGGLEVPERIEVFRIYPCRHCDELEAFFTREGIPYQLYDLRKDKNAESDYIRNIGRGLLPVTRVKNRHVRGFKPLQVLKLIQGEEIDPPAPDEVTMPAGSADAPEVPKASPQETAAQQFQNLKDTMERVMAHYDQVGKRFGGEDLLLYTEMARPEIEFKVIDNYAGNAKVLDQLSTGRQKAHYNKTVHKYVNLARRKVRKRHGRMIAINERLLKKWKEPLEQELRAKYDEISSAMLSAELAKADAAAAAEEGAEKQASEGKTAGAKALQVKPTAQPSAQKPKQPPKPEEIIIVR